MPRGSPRPRMHPKPTTMFEKFLYAIGIVLPAPNSHQLVLVDGGSESRNDGGVAAGP